jgi:signal transduction histidine kinase
VARRLILGAAYLLIVVVAGLAVPFGATLDRRLTQELGGRVEREAYAVAAAVEDPLERGTSQGLQSLIQNFAHQIGGRVLLTDRSGILLADSLQVPGNAPSSYRTRPEIALALAGTPNWEVRTSHTLGYDLLVSAVPIRSATGVLGAVRISYPMAQVRKAVHRTWWFLAAVGAATLAVGLLLAAWLSRWATRPLKRAAQVARRIAAGDLDARVAESGPPEVQELARDLNSMTERLSDLVRANREFAANASHQLRTPLTALRLSLEEALDGPESTAEIGHALQQADRLDAVVDSLLLLGRVHEAEGNGSHGVQPVELGAVACEAAAATAGDGPVVEVVGAGVARADPDRVHQVLANLVNNARRFARSKIRVTVQSRGDKVVVTVDDDGPGVAPDERDRLFDRFFRGSQPGGPGSGLGLAVAKELARVDGAVISVSATDLGGARFEVTYPSQNTPDS